MATRLQVFVLPAPSTNNSPPTMAAPSSPSSSCEIVDLAVAATLGDATSQLFFSKGGGGGDDLSWPDAGAINSTLTNEASLVALCDKFGVPKELKPVCADTGRAACDTPPAEGQLCIYSDALEAGLRFPMPAFYRKLLRHYGLAPSQLVPNAWAYMAAFVQLCEDAGVEPRVSAFRYLFSLCALKGKNGKPLGWHYFQHTSTGRPPHIQTFGTGRRRLFSGTLPTKSGWKSRFFFLEPPPEGMMQWGCPVAWGKPRREAVGVVKLTDAAVEKLKNLPCVEIKSLLRQHDPPVGAFNLLTTAPMPKLECAAASARAPSLTSLQATLDAGAREASAAGEGDDSTRRKRMCPGPSCSAAVAPQSLDISAAPPSLQRMQITPHTLFDGAAWGSSSSEISPPPGIPPPQGMGMTPCETSFHGAWSSSSSETFLPPGMSSSDSLHLYDAMVAMEAEKARLLQDNQQAAQDIAYLQHQLQQADNREAEANAMNAKFMGYWAASRAENEELKKKHASEIAKLNQERASEVAKLKDEHHKASPAHAEKSKAERTAEIAKLLDKHSDEVAKLNQEHASKVAKLQEKHADELAKLNKAHEVDLARVKDAAEEVAVEMVQDTKKNIALALFPHLDASLLNKFQSKNLH